MSSDTTSINQLPTASQSNSSSTPIQQTALGNNENIKIENYGQQLDAERKADVTMQPIDYTSQLTSVLKDASASGATILPSRDIPQNTLPTQQDEEIKPNFVPKTADDDYIGNILDREKVIQEKQKKQNQSDNMDYIYQQLQIPLIVAIYILYFSYLLFGVKCLYFYPIFLIKMEILIYLDIFLIV